MNLSENLPEFSVGSDKIYPVVESVGDHVFFQWRLRQPFQSDLYKNLPRKDVLIEIELYLESPYEIRVLGLYNYGLMCDVPPSLFHNIRGIVYSSFCWLLRTLLMRQEIMEEAMLFLEAYPERVVGKPSFHLIDYYRQMGFTTDNSDTDIHRMISRATGVPMKAPLRVILSKCAQNSKFLV